MIDLELIGKAFNAYEGAPTWEYDPVGRDAAIRWHMRGFLDALAVFRKHAAPEGHERTPIYDGNEHVCSGCVNSEGNNVAWDQVERTDHNATEWQCDQGCDAPNAVCLLDHNPAPADDAGQHTETEDGHKTGHTAASARVVLNDQVTSACASGYCPSGCSHMMWKCDTCQCEGGWGAPVGRLEDFAAEHACPEDTAPTNEDRETLKQVISDSVTRTADAILSAGFRRVAPAEPVKGWSTQDRREAECEARARFGEWERSESLRLKRYGSGSINGFILGAEWQKSRCAPAEPAVTDSHRDKK